MKYPARLLYFFGLLITTYIVLPIIFFIFCLVYFFWNLKWIPKSCLAEITAGWQEVQIGGLRGFPDHVYKTPFHYLVRKEKEI